MGVVKAILTLQLPTDDWRRGRILAACTDPALIRYFCEAVLTQRRADADDLSDPFDRELARLEIEQLEARLAFALGTGVGG